MAVSNQEIINFLKANPNMSDADIASAMKQYGISPEQMAKAVGMPVGKVAARIAATIQPGQAVLFGDTWVQPEYQIIGSGEDQQIGGITNVQMYKTTGGVNDEVAVGTEVQNYTPTGDFTNTTKTQKTESGFGEFLVGSALLFGGLGGAFDGLLSGGGAEVAAGTGTAGTGTVGTGLTGTGLTGTGITGTAGSLTGAAGLEGALGTGITGGATGLTGAAGLGADVLGTGLTTGGGLTGTGLLSGSTLGAELLGTGTGLAGLTGTGILTGSELGTGLLGTTGTTGLTGTGILTGSDLGTSLLGTGANTAATVGGVTGLTNAANVGAGALNTGVTTGITGLGNGALTTGVTGEGSTGVTTTGTGTTGTGTTTTGTGTTTTGTGTTVTDGLTGTLGGLTTAQILDLIKAGVSLAAITSLTGNNTTGTKTTTTTVPTQTTPLNSQDYYKAIQQSYNQMMPGAPRDVATPLQQWYSNEFSPSSGFTTAGLFGKELVGAFTPVGAGTATGTGTVATKPATTTPMGTGTVAPIGTTPINTAVTTPLSTASTVTKPVTTTTATTASPVSTTGLMSGNTMTPQAQVAAYLSNPTLKDLPPEAAARITELVTKPQSYQDIVNKGSVNTVDMSTLTPQQAAAYEVYQRSQITGVASPVAQAVYKAAGVDPTNPSAFFDQLGLQTGMPTKEAIAKYAPSVLNNWTTSGGNLAFGVDASTIPKGYTPPSIASNPAAYEGTALKAGLDKTLSEYATTIKNIYPNDTAKQNQLIKEQTDKLYNKYLPG